MILQIELNFRQISGFKLILKIFDKRPGGFRNLKTTEFIRTSPIFNSIEFSETIRIKPEGFLKSTKIVAVFKTPKKLYQSLVVLLVSTSFTRTELI